jgi:hypothetical protein
MNLTQKISQMTPKGADLDATDLIEVSTIVGGSYVTKSITGQELIDAIPLPPTGLTIGTTPISSGTIGRVLFEGTGNVLQQSANLTYNSATNLATIAGINLTTNVSGSFISVNEEISIQSTSLTRRIDLLQSSNVRLRVAGTTGNVLINTTTDAGFKLDVNGTARVQNDLTISRNHNGVTRVDVSNTTSGTAAFTEYRVSPNSLSSGTASFGKYSATTTAFKFILANDAYLYSGGSGDISILNDFSTGRIKFGAGASSTAQMTLFSTGNVGINTTTDAGFKLDVNGTARFVAPNTYAITYDINGNFNAAGAYSNFSLTNAAGSLRAKLNNDGPNGTLTLYQNATGYIFLNGAQSGNNSFISTALSIGNQSAANASSILELTSTTKGFLPPRMTTTQRNAISSPAAGLMVYDTTLNAMFYFNGTIWI